VFAASYASTSSVWSASYIRDHWRICSFRCSSARTATQKGGKTDESKERRMKKGKRQNNKIQRRTKQQNNKVTRNKEKQNDEK
jgi:hypothetical protein